MNWISPFVGIVLGALWLTTMAQMSGSVPASVLKTDLHPVLPMICCTLFDEAGEVATRRAFDPKSMRLK